MLGDGFLNAVKFTNLRIFCYQVYIKRTPVLTVSELTCIFRSNLVS